jgi:hypothetical protein
MNVMNSFIAHFAATEAEIVADETTGFATRIGDDLANYWVLFVRGVAHSVWTDAFTGEVVQSFPSNV